MLNLKNTDYCRPEKKIINYFMHDKKSVNSCFNFISFGN